MAKPDCHARLDGPLPAARTLVLKTLGVKRVAAWCGVGEATVYQWLSRGTAGSPIPPERIPSIVAGAQAEGLTFDVGVLWPAMQGLDVWAQAEGGTPLMPRRPRHECAIDQHRAAGQKTSTSQRPPDAS